jgi:hypothetical protein
MSETSFQYDGKRERRDIGPRGLILFGIVFILFISVSVTALWFVFGVRQGGFAAAVRLEQRPEPNDTELDQRDQLSSYMAAQGAELGRLAWTDAAKQAAKVPIADAMALMAAKGDRR